LLTVIVFLALKRTMKIPNGWRFALGLGIFLLIVIPWPLALVSRIPSVLDFFLQETSVKVYRAAGHTHGLFYFIPQIIVGSFPWVCFVPIALWWAYRHRERYDSLLPLTWAATVFVFFTLVQTKQSHYVVPIYPAIAILVGGALPSLAGAAELEFPRASRYTMLAFLVSITAASVALPVGAAVKFSPSLAQVAACSVSIIIAVIAWVCYRRDRTSGLLSAGLIFMFVFLLQAITVVVPLLNVEQSPRPFASEVTRKVPRDQPLGMYGNMRPHILYYFSREVTPVNSSNVSDFLSSDKPGYLVISEKDYATLDTDIPTHVILSYKDFAYQRRRFLLVKRG